MLLAFDQRMRRKYFRIFPFSMRNFSSWQICFRNLPRLPANIALFLLIRFGVLGVGNFYSLFFFFLRALFIKYA